MVHATRRMPGGNEKEERPRRELTDQSKATNGNQEGHRTENTANPPSAPLIPEHEREYTRPHEELVQAFQSFVQEQYQRYGRYWPPEKIVRSKLQLEWRSRPFGDEKRNIQRRDFFSNLLHAWDALTYERYEVGSSEEHLAGVFLESYYHDTHESTIKLSPVQIRTIDALTEVVGIPHQQGQTAIPIPEKLKNYTEYQLSPEYQEQRIKAKSTRRTGKNTV